MHVEIISTGGTYAALREHGIEARPVSDVTGFPEILDGRVKTLHPKIHGGLLAIDDNEQHRAQLREHGIQPIEMVVVNLYPFQQTVARPGVTLEEAVEQIDIGGPTMLRSAAKNYRHRAVVVNPDRYTDIIREMQECGGSLAESTCFALAREVFRHTSTYDAAIAGYLEQTAGGDSAFPPVLHVALKQEMHLRYGENPHQRAALYGTFGEAFEKLHGKELSYNNILDIAAAASLVADFEEPTVAIIKHSNPCGVGSSGTLADAYAKAFTTDKASSFGGIVAVNRVLDMEAAQRINEVFTEVIIAPEYPGEVLEFLRKKKDRRLIRVTPRFQPYAGLQMRAVPGGLLVQDHDAIRPEAEQFNVVTKRAPTEQEIKAMRFAWRVAKHVKSNAIVYAREDRTLGIGAGQMSRVDSSRIAAMKAREAGLDVTGSAVASDAYFPFPDGLLAAVEAGSTAVIQPGGSVRDGEVIAAADAHGIAMVCTGTRHFRH
jgi:phosphoribosylaminoimidazolecarboxamide formyltransferase/IMP cyclohydrolase